MLNGLDLFSGIGGLTLALDPWVRPVSFCENDRYCQAVILSRQSEGDLPPAPIWDDVTTLDGKEFRGVVDILYGGFPCQDISVAGSGEGLEGERSGLYWELHRLVREISPRWVFLENVPAIRTRGLLAVVRSLTDLGYDCRWTRVSAAEVGALHLRKRWFLLAHSNGKRLRNQRQRRSEGKAEVKAEFAHNGSSESLAHSNSEGLEKLGVESDRQEQPSFERDGGWWSSEPDVGRVAHGVPSRVDRIKALGNSVVPLQARIAFERLLGI